MSNQLTLPKGFGQLPSVFSGQASANDELGAGVMSSYGVIGYRGKVWSTKYQGKETPLMREDGDGPRGSIEVAMLKAASAISKIFYANGYQDGSNAAPDCWSSDGVKPDASCQNKQHATCAACPRNAWGSRVTEGGKPGKQCSDSRRMAVVPVNDITNEMMGGPMLLRVPAASLKDLKAYGDMLDSYGFPYYAVATRVSFDPKEAFPKFAFSAIRPLTEEEAAEVAELRGDKRVQQLLNEAIEQKLAAKEEEQDDVPASPFEQPQMSASPATSASLSTSPKATAASATKTATATAAAAPKTSPKATSKPAAKPIEEVTSEDEEEGAVPASFDQLLEDIL